MTENMKNKICKVFKNTIEPRIGLSILQLGVIKGVKYNTIVDKFFVYLDEAVTSKVRSVAFDFWGPKKLEILITGALKNEFPDISVRSYYL